MRTALLSLQVAMAVITITACGGNPDTGQSALPDGYAAQVQTWRDTHEADYRRDFVTIAGLHFLEAGTHTIGSRPGNDIVLETSLPSTIGRVRSRTTGSPSPNSAVRDSSAVKAIALGCGPKVNVGRVM